MTNRLQRQVERAVAELKSWKAWRDSLRMTEEQKLTIKETLEDLVLWSKRLEGLYLEVTDGMNENDWMHDVRIGFQESLTKAEKKING